MLAVKSERVSQAQHFLGHLGTGRELLSCVKHHMLAVFPKKKPTTLQFQQTCAQSYCIPRNQTPQWCYTAMGGKPRGRKSKGSYQKDIHKPVNHSQWCTRRMACPRRLLLHPRKPCRPGPAAQKSAGISAPQQTRSLTVTTLPADWASWWKWNAKLRAFRDT